LKEKEMTLKKTAEMRGELTTNELNLVTGGVPGIGIAYAHNGKGEANIAWAGNGGTWVIKEGQNGVNWVPN
jgi:hypothetical protein